jgi:hypothetical protein
MCWVMYRWVQFILVICCTLFLLAGDTHILQLAIGDLLTLIIFNLITSFSLTINSYNHVLGLSNERTS